MPHYVKILFLTMYLIGVFIKTRQLFLNKNSSVSLCVNVCMRD